MLEVVLEADVERTTLLNKEKEILEKFGSYNMNEQKLSLENSNLSGDDMMEIKKIYDRLNEIDAYSAESRASLILTGLQFSLSMQVIIIKKKNNKIIYFLKIEWSCFSIIRRLEK